MQYELKDYQTDAVAAVLSRLTRCARGWREDGALTSFALSSVTGSGKTIVAATVIEALLHGSEEFGVEADPSAVVLWVSKDPSLNEQTRARIGSAADNLQWGDLVLLDDDFTEDRLQQGTVYFINPSKLSSAGKLVRHTNKRSVTFWEVLDNTIRDKGLTLYVILDEAHEGMKPPAKAEEAERKTIVARIINGHEGHDAVPIVWGISATVKRFTDAMAVAENRDALSNVVVDPLRVQASGLLKSSLALDIPDESGNFETALIRDATREFVHVSRLWADYGKQEGLKDPVVPLMVVQIANKERGDGGLGKEDAAIAQVLGIVRQHYPDFTDDCVAHVLGDRDTIQVASYTIPRVKPQDIQDSTHIRVLLAKDAVSTGWDCPRAEVLVSLRPAKDHTYITQLLGRMVRTPLARSTSDARLDSASCYLPHFDRPTAKRIAEEIMGIATAAAGTAAEPAGPKVLFGAVDLTWNPNVPVEVGAFICGLPSLPKPAARPKPVKRLLQLAVALAQDGLAADPNETALEHLHSVLDGRMAQHKALIDAQAKAIQEAEIRRISATHGASAAAEERDVREADENTVKEAFGHTRRALSVAVANGYLRRIFEPEMQANVLTADLTACKARVAALSRVTVNDQPVVVQAVEDAADQLTRQWLDAHRTSIANLSEDRRAVYADIHAQAREPELLATELPTALRQEGKDDAGKDLPTQPKHVLSTPEGGYPIDPKALNEWERAVIDQELNRQSVVGWYRNPSAASRHSIRIPYKKNAEWSSLQPDFVFVDRNGDGDLVASLVDPHSGHLSDALARLRGIADFAEKHGAAYTRIDSLDTDKDKALRVLDMKDPDTRKAVRAAATSGDLFNGPYARRY